MTLPLQTLQQVKDGRLRAFRVHTHLLDEFCPEPKGNVRCITPMPADVEFVGMACDRLIGVFSIALASREYEARLEPGSAIEYIDPQFEWSREPYPEACPFTEKFGAFVVFVKSLALRPVEDYVIWPSMVRLFTGEDLAELDAPEPPLAPDKKSEPEADHV